MVVLGPDNTREKRPQEFHLVAENQFGQTDPATKKGSKAPQLLSYGEIFKKSLQR